MLLQLIDCIASGGTSATYGETTPYLDSLGELCSMWFDDLYHGAQALVDHNIFNPEEAEILGEFSAALERAYPHGYYPTGTNINKLQHDPTWLSVVRAAKDAQVKLRDLRS